MSELINLQITIFAAILVGVIVRKLNIVGAEGQKNITDLVIDVILPANIIKAFMIDFSTKMIRDFAGIFLISVCVQIVSVILGRILYPKMESGRRKCIQYGIICSNAGFMGNPISEGVFGSTGLLLTTIFLIPQRIMMWSRGLAIFTEAPDKKTLVLKVLKHPCIIACEIGLVIMITGFEPPAGITSAITVFSNCNTAMSMLVIGMILANANPRELVDKDILTYSLLRLVLIPLFFYIVLRMIHMDSLVLGVSVLMVAMPAGATTSILASKYDGDADFSARQVVLSTLLSLITTPIWSFLLTRGL